MEMSFLAAFVVAVVAVAPNDRPIDVRRETLRPRVEEARFQSRILGREKAFCVVLPEGYEASSGQYPVLYLLHGRGRHERSLLEDETTRKTLLEARSVTILPDGDDGWYIDSPARPADRHATYLDEVIRAAETTYRIRRDRRGRGLSGWSMGGYGCVRVALEHPGRFASVAPIIGLLDFPRRGLPEGQSYDVPIKRFGNDPSVWRRFNPMTNAKRLHGTSVLLITADRAFDRTMNEHFHRRLLELDIAHQWKMLRGGHTFAVVREALPLVLKHTEKVICSEE